MRRTKTTRSATAEITIKNVLLFRKEPNAAPVFVTLTRLKKSGITVRRFVGTNEPQDQPFCPLIERVERDREKEDEFHIFPAILVMSSGVETSLISRFNGERFLDSVPLRSTALGMTERGSWCRLFQGGDHALATVA